MTQSIPAHLSWGSYGFGMSTVFERFVHNSDRVLNSMRFYSVGDLQCNTVSEHILCRHRWSAGATEALQTRCPLCVDTVLWTGLYT